VGGVAADRPGFINSGTGRTRHIDIHASQRMTTEWLAED
jgi:hypothetical protein